MRRVAILDDYQGVALGLADWKSLGADVEVTALNDHVADEDKLARRIGDCEIAVIMRERTPFPRSLIDKLPNLKLLVTTGMRNRSVDVKAANERGITVCGTLSQAAPTYELAWALIMAIARQVPLEDRLTRAGAWQRTLGINLAKKTLGVIGLGRVGTAIAKIGRAFDMRVIAWSQNLTAARCAEVGVEFCPSKDELLKQSDFVTIHLILGPRNRGLIGARELGLMKPTSYLVNTSRGPIVDEPALIEALRQGTIGGAALDVFDVEPLPRDHPLRNMPNTVITPHIGYVSRDNLEQMYKTAVDNIRAWMAGKPQNVVLAE